MLVKHDDASELAEAIRTLIENPGLARRLASQGRQTVIRDYDEYKVAARDEEIYRHVLESGLSRLPDWKLETDQ
jgi:glycosyltransferase involved in cell wall biosynthesis